MERFVYLYEFLRHKKGSKAAKKKAAQEIEQLSRRRRSKLGKSNTALA
jgi:hypothetical protein